MRRIACLSCLSALLGAACNGGGGAASSFGTVTVTTAPVEQSSGSTGDDSAGGSSMGHVHEDSTSAGASGGGGTTLVLDVGAPDLGAPGPAGCRGKIDFLFVISRDSNDVPHEQDIQNKLIAAAPKFLDTIQERFADFDYHIMVVDTDEYWGDHYCNNFTYCFDESCTELDYPCEVLDSITSCDARLGAGTIYNAGEGTMNKPCGVVEGKRYLDRDQPNFDKTFECIARVGLGGGARIAGALVDAVTPERTGDCNGGFLRDDALLFVSFVSYVVESGSPSGTPGEPEKWAQAVIDAKHGDAGAAVMFSIQPLSGVGDADFEDCSKGKYFSQKLCDMFEFFPYRMVVDNLIPDYGGAFDQAADMVDEACSVFVPR